MVNYTYLFLIVVEAENARPRYWQIHFLVKFLLLAYGQSLSYYMLTQALLCTQEEKERNTQRGTQRRGKERKRGRERREEKRREEGRGEED